MNNAIELRNVSFSYKKGNPVLKNLEFFIKKGTFLGIIGVNGSGKSTFVYLLNGLIPHFIKGHLTGEILVNGISTKTQSVAFFAKKVGMVFQNPDQSIFNLTTREEIAFAIDNLKLDRKDERIKNALNLVSMRQYLDTDPQQLSFGQKQKVCLAVVLALDTDLIVLDEPTAMLDYKSSIELYRILQRLNNRGKTIIVVEHDTDFLAQFAHEILLFDKGQKIAAGPTAEMLADKKLLNKLGIKIPQPR